MWYTGCRNCLLHGCYVFLTSIYIRIDDRTGILWYPGVSDVWQLGQYRRSPRHWLSLVSCHFSFSLRFRPLRFRAGSLHSSSFDALFQIQIREIARRTVTLRLENWRTRNPVDHSNIDLKYRIRNSGCRWKMITLHLRALRELIRTRIGLREG